MVEVRERSVDRPLGVVVRLGEGADRDRVAGNGSDPVEALNELAGKLAAIRRDMNG